MGLNVQIEVLSIPGSLTAPDAADFLAAAELVNIIERHTTGTDDFYQPPQTQLVRAMPQPYEQTLLAIARQDDRVIGRARVTLPLSDNTHLADVLVQVHPDHRRRGVGLALYRWAAAQAVAAGRTTFSSWSDHPVTADGVPAGRELPAATGSGRVPLDAPSVAFALRLGFQLEQVERMSVLNLAGERDRLDALYRAQRPMESSPYELLSWRNDVPAPLLDAYAALRRTMSTAVPLGGMDFREEDWDGARVRHEEEQLRAGGGHMLVTVARHRSTGKLAGHTVLEHYPATAAVAIQNDTLVLPEHRGHGLGLSLKLANLRLLRAEWPTVQRIHTFNAAENGPMLSINEAMGFVPASYTAQWQLTVTPPANQVPGERTA
jgi:GNAT superfamily N-acetyltransferase